MLLHSLTICQTRKLTSKETKIWNFKKLHSCIQMMVGHHQNLFALIPPLSKSQLSILTSSSLLVFCMNRHNGRKKRLKARNKMSISICLIIHRLSKLWWEFRLRSPHPGDRNLGGVHWKTYSKPVFILQWELGGLQPNTPGNKLKASQMYYTWKKMAATIFSTFHNYRITCKRLCQSLWRNKFNSPNRCNPEFRIRGITTKG